MAQAAYKNADGMWVRPGPVEAVSAKYGEFTTFGQTRVFEQKIDFSDFAAFDTAKVLVNETSIPAGARIERVEVSVEKAFVGATATLSLGLVQEDRTTLTGLSATGLAAAITVATLVQGAILDLKVGASFVGALTGVLAPLAVNGLLTATVGTADFTAGIAKVRVFYSF